MEQSGLEVKITSLEKDIEALKTSSANFQKEVNRRLTDIEKESARTDERYKNIMDELKSINSKLNKLSEKPGKRWDTAINSAISAIVAGVVGFFAGRI